MVRFDGWVSEPAHGAPVARVLLLSADAAWAAARARALVGDGFAVRVAASNDTRTYALDGASYDLVIADVDDTVSLTALSAGIRALTDDVLLVTGHAERDVVAAIAGGADAYAVRTIAPRIFTARVRALLRRTFGQRGRTGFRADVQQIGSLRIASAGRTEDTGDPSTLVLDPDSFAILRLLLRRPGAVVSRPTLLDELGLPTTAGPALDLAVRRLRLQLEGRLPGRRIVAVRGVGYRYDDAPAEPAPETATADPIELLAEGVG